MYDDFISLDGLVKFAARQFDLNQYYQKYKNSFDKKGLSINDLWSIFLSDPTVTSADDQNFIFEEGYFTAWLDKQIVKSFNKLKSDASQGVLIATLDMYLKYKNDYSFPNLQLLDIDSLEKLVTDVEIQKEESKTEKLDYDTVFENESIVFYKVNNFETSKYFGDLVYGEGTDNQYNDTRWCVTKSRNLYNHYTGASGNSYFINDKTTGAWYAYFGDELQNVDNDNSVSENMELLVDLCDKSQNYLRKILPLDSYLYYTDSMPMVYESLEHGYKVSDRALYMAAEDNNVDLFNRILDTGVKMTSRLVDDFLIKPYSDNGLNDRGISDAILNNIDMASYPDIFEEAVYRDATNLVHDLINRGLKPTLKSVSYAINSGNFDLIEAMVTSIDITDETSILIQDAIFYSRFDVALMLLNLGVAPTFDALKQAISANNTYSNEQSLELVERIKGILNC